MYIITAEHRPNRDMGFVRRPSSSLPPNSNISIGAQRSPPPTPPRPYHLTHTPPNTIITLSILDTPHINALSFARSNDPQIPSLYWLMPHFSFWAWPLPFIGTLDSALARISAVETSTPWSKKIDKVVWRGTAWFNSVGNTNLRPKLLQVTKGKEWADVEDLKWFNNAEKARNSLLIEDFCKYKYIIYTEVLQNPLSPSHPVPISKENGG
jgi:Glycosyl transferase family 90